MSIHRRVRGMIQSKKFPAGLALLLAALVAPSVSAEPEAQLFTYGAEGGPTYFALSLTPASDQAAEASDVVVLFDTSASQTGAYRETAFAALEAAVAKLRPEDRVQLLAADLDARPLTDKLLPAGSGELRAAIAKLRGELPLGSTDMEGVLSAAASKFEADAKTNRTILYIGDGMSTANLLGTDGFRHLIDQLRAARISVSSYALGPRRDAALLAAIANQTGGNLYVDEPMALADDAAGISVDRANAENLRRGAKIGQQLADWTRVAVIWPQQVSLPAELGEVLPKQMPPLRSDRDTVVFGSTDKPLAAPLAITIKAEVAGAPADLKWTATPTASDDSYSYLAQVVDACSSRRRPHDARHRAGRVGRDGPRDGARPRGDDAVRRAGSSDRRRDFGPTYVAGRAAARSWQYPGENGAAGRRAQGCPCGARCEWQRIESSPHGAAACDAAASDAHRRKPVARRRCACRPVRPERRFHGRGGTGETRVRSNASPRGGEHGDRRAPNDGERPRFGWSIVEAGSAERRACSRVGTRGADAVDRQIADRAPRSAATSHDQRCVGRSPRGGTRRGPRTAAHYRTSGAWHRAAKAIDRPIRRLDRRTPLRRSD